MSAGDDDHDDDAQLKQLRAVWISMRDEDPPDRGLAALMAAAREKAAELEDAAKPSWWRRVVDSLRRPPVLALATVTVLLGGALILTQRGSQMKADQTAAIETDGKNRSSTADRLESKGGYVQPMTGGEQSFGSGTEAAGSAATVDKLADPETAKPAEVVTERQQPHVPKPVRTSKSPTTAISAPDMTGGTKEERPSADPKATFQAGPRTPGTAAPPALSIAQDDVPVEAEAAPRDAAATVEAKPKKPLARTPPPAIEGEDRTYKDTAKSQPTIEQLVKQCESAAARGDCVAVRVIAQKILSSSPAAYKSRVANNAGINRCLPSTAPNATSVE